MSDDKEAEDCTDHELLIRIDTKQDRILDDVNRLWSRTGENKEKSNRNEQKIKGNKHDIHWNRRWFGTGIVLGLLGIVIVAVLRLIMGL